MTYGFGFRALSLLLLLGCCRSGPAQAQEFSLLAGTARMQAPSESTYAWGFSYLQALDDYNALSYSWINEGHFVDHHRDGFALQYWRRTWWFDHRLALAAGAGVYNYFDTTASDQGQRYADVHGWALIYSLSATWYTNAKWFYQLRVNRTLSTHSINTTTAMFGLGYELGDRAAGGPHKYAGTDGGAGNELTVFGGKTEVNSLRSPGAFAKSIEYRHGFGPYAEASVAWLDEGYTALTRRNGAASQLWLGNSFFADKLRLSVGAGPYVAIDTYRVQGGTNTADKVSALFTMSARLNLTKHWLARASWDRVLTGYNKDSDIFLAGVGYRF